MHGFHPQNLAGGGLVQGIKRAFGMDEERNARVAAYKASQAADAAKAAASTPAPAPSPAPAPAVSDYSGMGAAQRREKAAGLANGGPVRGPGTGTSDSIATEKPEGTYIMPADSTQAIGEQELQGMGSRGFKPGGGKKVPVNLSNGEFELTPEQVHAVGVETLNGMKDSTHTPVQAQGFQPGETPDAARMFLANGGTVDEQERLRRMAQIPTGGTLPAPAYDGSGSTELSRNVNNGLNALGGMGTVASVPLRAATGARGFPMIEAPVAGRAADFVSGVGPNATTTATSAIPRLGNVPTPTLPGVNAALQEGAQANALAAAARAAGGAGAGANALQSRQPVDQSVAQIPAGAPTPAPVAPAVPLQQRVDQIPTGGMTAPRQPAPAAAPAAPGIFDGTRAVIAGAADDAQAAWNAGNPAQAAGAFARGALTAPFAATRDYAVGAVAPLASAARGFYGGLTGEAAPAPAAAPTAQPSTAATIAPRATTVGSAANPTDTRLAAGTQTGAADPRPMGQFAADQVENIAGPGGARQIAPGIFRSGNSYGDSAGAAVSGPATTGQPNAQNMRAAENLAARGFSPGAVAAAAPAPGVAAPIVRSSANDWNERNNLRNLEVSAKSITADGGRFDPTKGNNAAQTAYKAAVVTDNAARGFQPQADRAAMEANANLQREQMQQQGGLAREQTQQAGANNRAAQGFSVDRQRLGVEATRAASENASRNVATAGAEQVQKLRNVLLDPNATAEQRTQAEKSLRAIGGKAEAANRYTVVPGGQEISPQGLAYTRPSQVLDNQTGQFVNQPGAAGALPPGMTRQVGTANGRPVYEDAQGKRYGG